MKYTYSIQYTCSCRGPDGRRLGARCHRLWRADGKTWNGRHGSCGYAIFSLPTSAGTRQLKRFGYRSKAAASDAAKAVGELLSLASDDATRAKIGDLILAKTKRGGALPGKADVARKLGLGLDPGAPSITVGEWLDVWLAGKRRTKRASSYRSYEMHVRTWLRPNLGHLPLERLNSGHIEDLLARIEHYNQQIREQRAAGKALIEIEGDIRKQPRICGPSTQARIFATLRAAMNAAVKQRKVAWNPCAGVEMVTPETPERQRWTPAEAARFITHVAGDPMGLMFRVAVLRGCRRAELCGFAWRAADLDRGVLVVDDTLLQLGGKITPGKAKTRAGNRKIFLDRESALLLREHHTSQLRARMKAGPAWEDHDLIFCQADGRPWNPDHVSRRFKKLAEEAGVPVITLHEGGRHTGNSLMADADVPQELRMREVGHADRSVNDRYTHFLEEAHLAAAEQVAALVRKAGSGT